MNIHPLLTIIETQRDTKKKTQSCESAKLFRSHLQFAKLCISIPVATMVLPVSYIKRAVEIVIGLLILGAKIPERARFDWRCDDSFIASRLNCLVHQISETCFLFFNDRHERQASELATSLKLAVATAIIVAAESLHTAPEASVSLASGLNSTKYYWWWHSATMRSNDHFTVRCSQFILLTLDAPWAMGTISCYIL